MERKKAIRQQLLAIRNGLPSKQQKEYNEQILFQLLEHPWYKEARQILLYISYGSEVDTLELCRSCFRDKKEVYCPRILGKGRMEFYAIRSLQELVVGYRGIREPIGQQLFCSYGEKRANVLMIMPLVGFDRAGNRLGYGGGFYDRYLEGKSDINTIALAFYEQYWQEPIPVQEYDVRPRLILTPKGFWGQEKQDCSH